MDTQIAALLAKFLPPELIAEIEAYLIADYCRGNARACADAVRSELRVMNEYKIFGRIVLRYVICSYCNQIDSYRYYDTKLMSWTFSMCASSINAMKCSLGLGRLVEQRPDRIIVTMKDRTQEVEPEVARICKL